MKLRIIASCIIIVALMLSSCNMMKKDVSLNTETDTISYLLGNNIGTNIAQEGLDTVLDLELIARGIQDAVDSADLPIDQMQAQMIIQTYFMKRQQQQIERMYGHNKTEANEFLSQNRNRPEVTELPNGLQYEILVEGKGPKPAQGDKVTTNYTGTFLDGTKFDSSFDRNEPFTFMVGGRVIPAWNEVIKLMSVGAKYKIWAPYQLAYGDRGYGNIEPFKMLIFEMELLSIEPKEEQK
ncbi:MAG: FKBP-type peptidyl-prolyl cis-trans isomerase [Bacteroidales bacterium]|nr:FKBP-type peptidyl-prolyl cis-trans isomerase [Bacteroidales bacterium]